MVRAMQPEPGRLNYYLEDTIVIDWHTPEVLARADLLAEPHADEIGRVRAVSTGPLQPLPMTVFVAGRKAASSER